MSDHPKIEQLRRDVYTHCPEFSTYADFEMRKSYIIGPTTFCVATVRLKLVGVLIRFFSGCDAYDTPSGYHVVDDAAEDEAIQEMWEFLRKNGVSFNRCSDAACKVCAAFCAFEEKRRAREIEDLKLHIADLEKQALPLKARLTELETTDKK